MPVKAKRNPTNTALEGKIIGLDEEEKQVLKDSGIGTLTFDDFDSSLFAMEDNKISLSHIYNENGILSFVSDSDYAIDIKDYVKIIGSNGDILASFNDTDIAIYRAMEIQEPTLDSNPATKKYVDDLFNSIVNGDALKY